MRKQYERTLAEEKGTKLIVMGEKSRERDRRGGREKGRQRSRGNSRRRY